MEKIKVYKVIEEKMSPSGRVEYFSLPLYNSITEDEINGNLLYKPKESIKNFMLNKWGIKIINNTKNEDEFVYAFMTYDSALEYMQEYFKGYLYTRPVIYECETEINELPGMLMV